MRSLIALAAFAVFSSLGWADDRPAGIPEEARYAKVDRVIDGDTIVLMDRSRVRLEGIDAPERDQPYGPVATVALDHMVGRAIYYVETDKDRYDRMLATLYPLQGGLQHQRLTRVRWVRLLVREVRTRQPVVRGASEGGS